MVESAMRSAELAEESGLSHDHIILSAKVSGVQDLVAVYRMLGERSDYPLHLGLTERAWVRRASSQVPPRLSILLQEGIRRHDSRVAHPAPRRRSDRGSAGGATGAPITRHSQLHPTGHACPGVVAQLRRSFRRWRSRSRHILRDQRPAWQARYPGSEELRVAVMGCVVNGTGESEARRPSAFRCRGTARAARARVRRRCCSRLTLKGDTIVADFLRLLDDYVEKPVRGGRLANRSAQRTSPAIGVDQTDVALPKNHA